MRACAPAPAGDADPTPGALVARARSWLAPIAFGAAAAVALSAAVAPKHGVAATVVFALIAVSVAYTGWALVAALGALWAPALDLDPPPDPEAEALEHEKQLLLAGIKELEADFAMAKVDPEDYAALRASAEAKSLQIIRRQRADRARWEGAAEALLTDQSPATGLNPQAPSTDARTPTAGSDTRAPTTGPGPGGQPPAGGFAAAAVFDDRPSPATRGEQGELRCACGGQTPAPANYCPRCGRPLEQPE